eukprot:364137-Chlamydomonas_euryale.AAC.4
MHYGMLQSSTKQYTSGCQQHNGACWFRTNAHAPLSCRRAPCGPDAMGAGRVSGGRDAWCVATHACTCCSTCAWCGQTHRRLAHTIHALPPAAGKDAQARQRSLAAVLYGRRLVVAEHVGDLLREAVQLPGLHAELTQIGIQKREKCL